MGQITIGVMLDSDFEYGVAVYEGIRRAVDKQPGWSIVPVMQSQQPLLYRLAQAGQLDGIIAPVISDRWVEGLGAVVPAIVNISNISKITSIPSVVPNDYAVGSLAAQHLIDIGAKRVGIIHERSVYASIQRRDGCCHVFGQAGVSVEQPAIEGAYHYEDEWENWLKTLHGEISLYGTSDNLVRRFMKIYNTLRDSLDLKVGAVVGTGDSLVERTLSGIEISSVVLPAGRVGVEAVKLMKRLLDGDSRVERREINPALFKVRLSSSIIGRSDAVIIRAQGYIERSLSEMFSVADVAKHAGASRRKLEMRFKDELGISPAAYIREKRMKLAERLLQETGMTVREVAARCGAGSLQAFTTQFKLYHGVPPGKFSQLSKTST